MQKLINTILHYPKFVVLIFLSLALLSIFFTLNNLKIDTSTDNGSNWSSQTSGTSQYLYGVTYKNKKFVKSLGSDSSAQDTTKLSRQFYIKA